MNNQVTPTIASYLFFGGKCEEALLFYQSAIGAELKLLMRFRDSPEPVPEGVLPPGFEDKVMHASFVIGDTQLMASDGCETGGGFSGFSLSLSYATNAEAEEVFARLGDGGEVSMPLAETFFAPLFGSVTDRFGVNWMVLVNPEEPA